MKTIVLKLGITLVCTALLESAVSAQVTNVLTVAVFDFESSDEVVRDLGPKVAGLISAQLSTNPHLITVERAELEKVLGEQEFGLSGTVQPETVSKVGHLTGAQVLVTGRLFNMGNETVVVAKIIGTETGRVYGEVLKAKAGSSVVDMSAKISGRIAKVVQARADVLLAKVEKPEALIARLRKGTEGRKRPSVAIRIVERHFGGLAIDPAAETEVAFILQKLGFLVLDGHDSASKPDVEVVGEAFSEFGTRRGNLVSCRARMELKATDRQTGRVLFIDRQVCVAVDLSEYLAGKAATQEAAAKLTERLLPELIR